MTEFFDALETREPREREAQLMRRWPQQVAHAQPEHGCVRQILAASTPPRSRRARRWRGCRSRASTNCWRRSASNARSDPFGGFSALVRGPAMPRMFASPGPIYEPEGAARDYWRSARAMYAAGFRAGDLVHNAFSYHMTPGAFIMEAGAHALGCTVFPAGVGQTEQQLQAIAELRPDALHRHAQLPAHPGREGAGDRHRHRAACARR